jgi:hypothetical protein
MQACRNLTMFFDPFCFMSSMSSMFSMFSGACLRRWVGPCDRSRTRLTLEDPSKGHPKRGPWEAWYSGNGPKRTVANC